MSRIYFHSPSGEAELRGSERAHMGGMAIGALLDALRLRDVANGDEIAAVAAAVVGSPGYDLTARDGQALATYLSVGSNAALRVGDETMPAFTLALNTLIANGSDPAILAARLHGQCEIHAWVAGPNRAWLAEIIDRGRASGIFRRDQGWEGVAALLRSDPGWPVVTSYSVCEGFPNSRLAIDAGLWNPPLDSEGEPNYDAWYELSEAVQWHQCVDVIGGDKWLEMNPERWRWPSYYFGLPITAHHALEAALKTEGHLE